MSYVHDFTDCPINKSVLDYYDRQQKIIDENQQQKTKSDVSLGKASASKTFLKTGYKITKSCSNFSIHHHSSYT